jgi:hypothetical protein
MTLSAQFKIFCTYIGLNIFLFFHAVITIVKNMIPL